MPLLASSVTVAAATTHPLPRTTNRSPPRPGAHGSTMRNLLPRPRTTRMTARP